jgi:hypothetical protein
METVIAQLPPAGDMQSVILFLQKLIEAQRAKG